MCKIVCKIHSLKMVCNSLYQKAEWGQLTLFPPTYFDLVIAGGVCECNYSHHISFLVENCYLMIWNLADILTFNKTVLNMTWNFFTEVIICQYLLEVTLLLLVFVTMETLIKIFLCFSAFWEFQYHFCKNTFVLTFVMGIFYFILVWRLLKSIKFLKNVFSYPPPTDLQY